MSLAQQGPSAENTARNKRPAPRGSAAYPRKRAVTACQVCRSRRTKCDNQRPTCGFCSRSGAQCNYVTGSDDCSTYDAASLRILERLDELETLLRNSSHHSPEVAKIRELQATEVVSTSNTSKTTNAAWLLPSDPDSLLTSINGKQRLHALLTLDASQCLDSSSTRSPVAVADLDPSSSKQLLDNFFNYVHVKNPILREDEVRRMVSRLCLYGVDWTTESCLALLICALGSIATPFGDSHNVGPDSAAYVASQSYFRAAQRRLGNCLTRSGVLEAQCVFLAGVYQMCIFKPFDAWRLFSQSLSCCQSFSFLGDRGTLSSPGTSPALPGESEHLRAAEQSVYWSAWKSELELKINWDMPDFSSPQAGTFYPPFFPTPPSLGPYQDISEDGIRVGRESIGWYFYLSEISLKRLVSRLSDDILRCGMGSGLNIMDDLAEALPERQAEVQAWLQALPEPISLDTSPDLDDVCKFVLRGHLINAYELLYWPFLSHYVLEAVCSQSVVSHERSNSFSQTEKYKSLAEEALCWHVERLRTNRPGFRHRHHGTWFAILSCSRSAVMLINAYKFNTYNPTGIQLTMPDGWQQAIIDGVQLNAYWQDEVPDAQARHTVLVNLLKDLDICHDAHG